MPYREEFHQYLRTRAGLHRFHSVCRCYLCVTNFAPFREVLNIEHARHDVLNYVKLTRTNLLLISRAVHSLKEL